MRIDSWQRGQRNSRSVAVICIHRETYGCVEYEVPVLVYRRRFETAPHLSQRRGGLRRSAAASKNRPGHRLVLVGAAEAS